MKQILTYVIILTVLIACQQNPESSNTTSPSGIVSSNGIYYWKTRFCLDDYELDFLKKHEISRIYVKMFDVVLQNDSQDDTLSVIPIATTRFESPIPDGIEIVPTVYITYEALSHLKGKDREYIESYAQRIMTRVDAMISYNEIQKVREVQFDCDWTSNTSYAYRCICDYAKRNLNKNGRKFTHIPRIPSFGAETFVDCRQVDTVFLHHLQLLLDRKIVDLACNGLVIRRKASFLFNVKISPSTRGLQDASLHIP